MRVLQNDQFDKEGGTMHRWRKKSVALVIISALVLTTTGFQAVAGDDELLEEGTAESMIADFVFVRPVAITATVVGTAFFIASLPFSLAGLNTEAAFQKLVADPAEFTFARKLGTLVH